MSYGIMLEKNHQTLNLSPKFGLVKKTPLTSFINRLLENVSIEFAFPYAPLPYHKGAKQDTIGVTKGTNVNCHTIRVLC
jgi:hypothetical protein